MKTTFPAGYSYVFFTPPRKAVFNGCPMMAMTWFSDWPICKDARRLASSFDTEV